jgi:hypothetical protein
VQGSDRRAIESNEAPTVEDTVDDRLPETLIVEHASPRLQRFVRRKDHGPTAAMALVDDVKEHVGRIGPIGEITDLVDDQYRGVRVERERVGELPLPERSGEIVDERGGGGTEGIEAVSDRAVGDGDRQVRLPAAGFARKKERSSVGSARCTRSRQTRRALARCSRLKRARRDRDRPRS